MDYRTLGQSSLTVSAICLGTMTFGEQNSEADAHAQLDMAYDRGISFVDAAELYPVPARAETSGRTEVLHREGVGLLAYSPLAFGHLSGKYLENPSAPGRITRFATFGQRYGKPNVLAAVHEYVRLARESGLTPVQLALAYVYHRWCVTSTIIGATTLEQLRANLDAWDTRLKI